ncbi:MAG: hypothetical protein ACLQKK_00440 [Rhodomicrobium sp.]
MTKFSSGCWLILGCFLALPPALCHAHGCKIEMVSAAVHAVVSAGQGCSQKVEVKVCAPAGKAIKSSSVKGLSASPNIDFNSEVKDAGGGCVEAKVMVWSRSTIGPAFLAYCPEGSYDGRVELTYCR